MPASVSRWFVLDIEVTEHLCTNGVCCIVKSFIALYQHLFDVNCLGNTVHMVLLDCTLKYWAEVIALFDQDPRKILSRGIWAFLAFRNKDVRV
jgi:hypothetical protein